MTMKRTLNSESSVTARVKPMMTDCRERGGRQCLETGSARARKIESSDGELSADDLDSDSRGSKHLKSQTWTQGQSLLKGKDPRAEKENAPNSRVATPMT